MDKDLKFQMHIIESGEVVKPLATLATLTNLPRKDAHYTCYEVTPYGEHPKDSTCRYTCLITKFWLKL